MRIMGKNNTAEVFTDNIDEKTIEQIRELCNQPTFSNSTIRIMPDCHLGVGCTIGTTMTIKDKIVPNLVGVDLGCGVTSIRLQNRDLDLERLDNVIKKAIPSGFKTHTRSRKRLLDEYNINLEELRCGYNDKVKINRGYNSVGTLGGGNHFIEVNKSEKFDDYNLVVHSGSRGLGLMVANHYQKIAEKYCLNLYKDKFKEEKANLIESIDENRLIGDAISELRANFWKPSKALSYLVGQDMADYLHDLDIMQRYASLNRAVILADIIVNYEPNGPKFIDTLESIITADSKIESIHNYLSIDEMILRKGAISAHKDEHLIIPINMRDGSIIGRGKGNSDWNNSAPHGAGRLLSRRQAKQNLKLDNVKKQMNGIYTTSLSKNTLDEAPDAYKPIDDILNNINETVEIIDIIKPIYNFKADD